MSRPTLLKSRWFQILVGLAITLACLGWAFYSMTANENPRVVLKRIGSAFSQADYGTLPFLMLILVVFYWLKAIRWRLLLAPVGEFDATRDLLPPIMAGFAANNLFPLRAGELLRVFLFARRQRVAMSTVLASVAVERILDALTILCLLGVGIAQLDSVDPEIHRRLVLGGTVVVAAVVCIVVYLVWTRPFIRIASWCLQRVPLLRGRFEQKVIGILEAGALGMTALKHGRLLGGIALTSLAQWCLNALLIYCSLTAFSIRVPWPTSLVLMGVVAFGVAAPSVPGFFGIIQACFLLVLSAFPYRQETIFAASIYFHMAQYIPVTLVGVICANRLGFRLGKIRPDELSNDPDAPSVRSEPSN